MVNCVMPLAIEPPPQSAPKPKLKVRTTTPRRTPQEKARASSPYQRPTTGTLAPRSLVPVREAQTPPAGTRPGPGIGKGYYGLTPPKRTESVDSSPGKKTVARHSPVPPINGPPGQFQHNPERGRQPMSPNAQLLAKCIREVRDLRITLAKVQLKKANVEKTMEKKISALELGLTSKVKRLYEICGKGDQFFADP